MSDIITNILGKIYPDNWFSVGFTPKKKKRSEDSEYDKDYEYQYDSYTTIETTYCSCEIKEHKFFDGELRNPDRFISSPQSSQTRKRYGTKGISANGKRTVKAASALLQQMYGRRRLGFVTLTLPNYSKQQISYLSSNWGRIVRVYFQRLKRLVESRGLPFLYVCTTEIQEKRYKKTSVIAPHLHYCYVARGVKHASDFYVSASEIRELWGSVISYYVAKSKYTCNKEISFNASVDCQVV